MPLYRVKVFVNFGPVTPELTEFICEVMVRHGKNWRIQPNISGWTGPIFTIISRYESTLRVDYRPGPLFLIVKGCCHGNQSILEENNVTAAEFCLAIKTAKVLSLWVAHHRGRSLLTTVALLCWQAACDDKLGVGRLAHQGAIFLKLSQEGIEMERELFMGL